LYSSSNVVILTDFDISGKSIAIQLPGVKCIGIDFQHSKHMGIDLDKQREELQETYTPNKEHLTNLLRLHSDEVPRLDYMLEKRIENNAVKRWRDLINYGSR
jgi:5S rRNA maturation endonuclease (ribonuclease M5)